MTIQNNIDKLFNKGLADYEESPPGFVWNTIEQNLNKHRVRKHNNWLYSIAAAVALLLSFGAGYLVTNVKNNNLMVDYTVNMNSGNTTIEQVNKYNESVNNSTSTDTTAINDPSQNTSNIVIKDSMIHKNVDPKPATPNQTNKPTGNIKRANSEGILLPPMFGSNADNVAFNAVDDKQDNADESLMTSNDNQNSSELSKMETRLPREKNVSPTLNYDERNYRSLELAVFEPELTTYKYDNRWSVGMAAAPLWSFRNVAEGSTNLAANVDGELRADNSYDNEKPLMAYSAGANVNYKVASRWKVKSGLFFSEIGQISENVNLPAAPYYLDNSKISINTSTGNIIVDNNLGVFYDGITSLNDNSFDDMPPIFNSGESEMSQEQVSVVQTYTYFEIPLMVDYVIIDRKFDLNIAGGFSTNILTSNNAYIEEDGTRYTLNAETENLNTMNYSGIVGVGMEYPIITRLILGFQPTFRYSLNAINNSGSVYPYSFGLYTGLRYTF